MYANCQDNYATKSLTAQHEYTILPPSKETAMLITTTYGIEIVVLFVLYIKFDIELIPLQY